MLIKFQLQLVANLGKLYDVPLNPDDPEDILTILAFALGGSTADGIGTGWNYTSTQTVAKIAIKHFKQRSKELGSDVDAT